MFFFFKYYLLLGTVDYCCQPTKASTNLIISNARETEGGEYKSILY